MKRVVEPLKQAGAQIFGRQSASRLPLSILGSRNLLSIKHRLAVASAQVKSSLLLAGLLGSGAVVSGGGKSRDHTERLLHKMGANIEVGSDSISVEPGPINALSFEVPSDFSSAAFFIVAALMGTGGVLYLPAINVNPTRAGLLRHLLRMGAQIDLEEIEGIEPTANIKVSGSKGMLKNVPLDPTDLPTMIDEIPILTLLCSISRGDFVLEGLSELRVKESDRIKSTISVLRDFGISVAEKGDSIVGSGLQNIRAAQTHAHHDHRIAMMAAVASMYANGPSTVEGFSCVDISCPQFLELCTQCGVRHKSGLLGDKQHTIG